MDKFFSLDVIQKQKEFQERKPSSGSEDFVKRVQEEEDKWKKLMSDIIKQINSGDSTPQIAELVKQRDSAKKKCSDLEASLDQVRTELDEEKKASADLRKQLDEKKQNYDDITKELEQEKQKSAALKAQMEDENQRLSRQLKEEQDKNAALMRQLEAADDLKKQLEAAKAELEQRVKEFEDEKAVHPIFADPKIKDEVLVFDPQVHKNEDGTTTVLYLKTEGTYGFFFIDKDEVKAMIEDGRLDPKKKAKCLVRDYETHCSTDEPDETARAEAYHMPKGEDYYICKGEISKVD